MQLRILLAAAAVALLAAGYYLLAPAPPPHEAPMVTTAPPPEENVTLRTNDDPQEVFQRAFWRRPTAEDRILHAERREWVSEEDGVRRWQWFLAVQPGAALDQWLREDNAFGLAKVASGTSIEDFPQAPSWFPKPNEIAGCEIHQTAGKKMTLIFDPAKKVLYATDAGHGFAVARANAAQPLRALGISFDPSTQTARRGQ
jgi:hypothetical protein